MHSPHSLPSLLLVLDVLRAGTAAWVRAHRRGFAAVAMLGLAGFAVTALAIAPLAAISSFGPDAADLPRVTFTEPLPLPALAPQLRELAEHHFELSRGTVSRRSDSLEALLARLGVNDSEAATFLKRDAGTARVLIGRSGHLLRARSESNGRLIELSARYPAENRARRGTHFNRLVVRRDDTGQWQAQVDEVAYDKQLRLAAGIIRSSLFAATDAADVPDAVAVQVAEIFAVDIDFHRELRRGDRFVVVYEVLSADGETVPWREGSGRVLAAEFVNAGHTYQALWFADPAAEEGGAKDGAAGRSSAVSTGGTGGTGGAYYAPDGTSRRRAFLASPLEFSRVSSGFAMRRDPINRRWRAHLGVDYAAPTGTPVRTIGDGKVLAAGRMGGYGNAVTVAHANGRVTLYAHLSRIDVKSGQRVEQGQRLGAVGATGWATGPHLHFEFRVMGKHQDPLAMARKAEVVPLAPRAMAMFMAQRGRTLGQLELAASLVDSSEQGTR